MLFSSTYTGSGSANWRDATAWWQLTGDKSKFYKPALLKDDDDVLQLLSRHAAARTGEKLHGFIYYLVGSDDTNFLVTVETEDGTQYFTIR